MAVIQANRCLFQVKQDGVYTTVMCTRSFRVNPVTVEKEITAPIDGKFKSFDYSQLTGNINVDGVLVRDLTTQTMFSFPEAQLNFLELDIRVIFIDELNLPKVFRCQCIVSNATMEASAGQTGGGTVELLISGEYIIEDALPEFVNLRLLISNSPTSQAFLKFNLIDSTGSTIFQTDTLPQASGGNLANPLDITVPVPKGNWYYWFQFDSNNVGNILNLDAPPTRTVGFNNGIYNEGSYPNLTYDFTADRTLSVTLGVNNPPPTCVPPSVIQGLNNPTAIEGVPWSAIVTLAGSQPFSLSNITKPAWVNISISGSTITLSGNPVAGLNQGIGFDITNACGTVNTNDQIDVSANPNAIQLDINYTETLSGIPATVTGFHLYVNAVNYLNLLTTRSESTLVNPGDIIELRITGTSGRNSHFDVTGTVDGLIMNEDSTQATFIRTFTAVAGNNYTINATTM